MSVSSPTGVALASVAANASNSAKMAAYDGSANYAGSSGIALVLTGTGSTPAAWQQGSTNLSNFTGTGSVPFDRRGYHSPARQRACEPLQLSTHAVGGSVVTLQYAYRGLAVLRPASSPSSAWAAWTNSSRFPRSTGLPLSPPRRRPSPSPDSTTGWSSSVPVRQFDPALGALQSVNLSRYPCQRGRGETWMRPHRISPPARQRRSPLDRCCPPQPRSARCRFPGGADRIDQGLSQTACRTGTLTGAE